MNKKWKIAFSPLFCLLFACSSSDPSQNQSSEPIAPAILSKMEENGAGLLSFPLYNHQSVPGDDEYHYAPSVIWDGCAEGSEAVASGGGRSINVGVKKGERITYEIELGNEDPYYLFAYLSQEDYGKAKEAYASLPSMMGRDLSASFEDGEDIIDGKLLSGYSFADVEEKSLALYASSSPNAPLELEGGDRLVFCARAMDGHIVYDLSAGEEKLSLFHLLERCPLKETKEGYAILHPSFSKADPQSKLSFGEGRFLLSLARDVFEEGRFLFAKTANTNYPIYPIEKKADADYLIGPTQGEAGDGEGFLDVDYLHDEFSFSTDLYGSHKEKFLAVLSKDEVSYNEVYHCWNGAFDYEAVKEMVKTAFAS